MKNTILQLIAISLVVGCSKTTTQVEKTSTLPKATIRKELGQPKKLALGYEHSCALFNSGQVMCWGSSSVKQLGDVAGKKIRATIPHLLPYITDAIDIDSFANQTCLLRKTGEVVCFGGDGGKNGMRAVHGVSAANTIAVARSTACAASPTELWCWGKSKGGQIPGTFEFRSESGVKLDRVYENISASESSFFGKRKKGWDGWGENKGNIFRSDSHKVNGYTKIPNTNSFAGMASRTGVVCGWSSSEVECWAKSGQNDSSTLKPKGIVGNISKVVVGNEFACALAGKNIFCWGGNGQGTLGDGTRKSRPDAKAVEGLENVIDIDAGAAHVCAATTEYVYCWGNSRSGQVGTDSRLVKTNPVQLKFESIEGRKY